MSLIHTAAILAHEGAKEEGTQVSPYVFGGIALAVLLLLLYAVTRMNPDR